MGKEDYPIINKNLSVGEVYSTTKDGQVELVALFTKPRYLSTVRFIETGNEYTVGTDCLKRGVVRDHLRDRTPEFVARCLEKYGDKYSYAKTKYIGHHLPVTVTCNEHGDFETQPNYILHRECCPFCKKGGATRIRVSSLATFLASAAEVHGGRYSYGNVVYSKSTNYVQITCKKHGDFKQTPNAHVQGCGCPKCAVEDSSARLSGTVEDFVRKAKEVHGDKYDYTNTMYVNSSTKVEIACRKHGVFLQSPGNHLQGKGCKKCQADNQSIRTRFSKERFVEAARKAHGDYYDYSKVVYKGSQEHVEIICPKHGVFWQAPKHHVAGHTCEKCGKDRVAEIHAFTKDEFISRAESAHGNKYDYSQIKYKNCVSKVKIVCPEHGEFWQNAGSHLSGVGCRSCAITGFNKSLVGNLYVLCSDNYVKVGITNREVHKRLAEINSKSPEEFKVHHVFILDGYNCYDTEQRTLKWLRSFAKNPPKKFQGWKESFYKVPVEKVMRRIMEDING